ncbi:MAG: hypothetical protein A2827_01265 [Candidatus Spechtbacteria bacterium RIFCSPHIGHO2_01_FULL_43_30]|uniref:Uncharacterized protein n=1 Tax=Candidatus Spechtbacteria bacterium RIFCSPHIGHO2_01_FULL_43_30 TaxID=1802158 RepID=A0A1G2H583_9BACT|nr:MAG: hypothetical protein A2827_01265 [Candidatus Spechtbacteria bacterium RIFCSPHIGHO2_01_FULL_43_30]
MEVVRGDMGEFVVSYGINEFSHVLSVPMGRSLVEKWKEGGEEDAIVLLEAEVAGSPVVYALDHLRLRVVQGGGRLIVVGWPADYMEIIKFCLPSLPGLLLAKTVSEALAILATK